MYYGLDGERLESGANLDYSRPLEDGQVRDGYDSAETEEQHGLGSDTKSEGDVSLASLQHLSTLESLEAGFRDAKPADIGGEEEVEILQLIQLALQPDIQTRGSADQLLQLAWLRG